MILNVYALLDTKAGYFGAPFYAQTHGEAMRICIDAATDMRSTIARYPNDFTLYAIGQYDNTTAFIKTEMPDPIGVIGNMLPRQPPLPLEQHAQLTPEPTSLNGAANHG